MGAMSINAAPARAALSVAGARRRAWLFLAALVPPATAEAADSVVLVVSELVTNALLHGGGTCVAEPTAHPEDIEVAVHDPSPQPPRMRPRPDRGHQRLRLAHGQRPCPHPRRHPRPVRRQRGLPTRSGRARGGRPAVRFRRFALPMARGLPAEGNRPALLPAHISRGRVSPYLMPPPRVCRGRMAASTAVGRPCAGCSPAVMGISEFGRKYSSPHSVRCSTEWGLPASAARMSAGAARS